MKIGFDIDGVLCNIDVAMLRSIDNITPKDAKDSVESWYYRDRHPLLNPELFKALDDEIYILTSRPKRLWRITHLWIDKFVPNATLRFVDHQTLTTNSPEGIRDWLKLMATKKAKVINELKLDVYFEDIPHTVRWLRKLCPNCKIIQYGGRIET